MYVYGKFCCVFHAVPTFFNSIEFSSIHFGRFCFSTEEQPPLMFYQQQIPNVQNIPQVGTQFDFNLISAVDRDFELLCCQRVRCLTVWPSIVMPLVKI